MSQNKIGFHLIVATGENGEIGIGNELLGHFPTDMAHFKEKTLHSVVIMGRKTFESLRIKPLPKRENIVITRNENFSYPGVYAAHSVEEATGKARDLSAGKCPVFVIGGAEIYREFIRNEGIDRIYLTKIHKSFEQADQFIELPDNWRVTESKSVFADGVDMDFVTLER